MSVEIAWKQNILVTDSYLLKLLLVVFGFGLQAFVCDFSRQNICSVPVYKNNKVFTCSYTCNLHVIIDSVQLAQTSLNLRFCFIKRSPSLSFIRRTLSFGNAVWLCRKKWLACNATHTAFAEKKVTSYKCHYLINSLVTFVFHF